MSVSQSAQLKNALWENTARFARTEEIPTLSRILGVTILATDLQDTSNSRITGNAAKVCVCAKDGSQVVNGTRYYRDCIKSRLLEVQTRQFCFLDDLRTSEVHAYKAPSAEAVMSLLDWDTDDVFVFDGSQNLIVHVDVGEDWLKPEEMGVSPREMLYIISTPS